jgi:ubiquinone/menaquinone biosynthesis C-methylase UbiE
MSWWDNRCTIEQFRGWVRGIDDPSRKYVRDYIISKQPESVLDVAAGLCEDYDGLKRDAPNILYTAIDFTDQFVQYGKDRGINIIKADCDNLPFRGGTIDIVYCRHLIEHLHYYAETINEMIRVSRNEVIVTFFLPAIDKEEDEIRIVDSLNHNFYSKKKMESFLLSNKKVKDFRWEDFGKDEQMLFISLK